MPHFVYQRCFPYGNVAWSGHLERLIRRAPRPVPHQSWARITIPNHPNGNLNVNARAAALMPFHCQAAQAGPRRCGTFSGSALVLRSRCWGPARPFAAPRVAQGARRCPGRLIIILIIMITAGVRMPPDASRCLSCLPCLPEPTPGASPQFLSDSREARTIL